MSKVKIRIGVLGLTHDHIWGHLDNLMKLDQAELVGTAEPNEALRSKFVERYGDRICIPDYLGLFDRRLDLQAVFVFADNRTSAELGIMAAEHGLHVMLEKPMASTLTLANALAAAGRRSGVQVMINWPHYWNPKIRTAYRLVREGLIGDVYKLRYCAGHAGPREIGCSPMFCEWLYDSARNGAGALTDQAGYAATICRWFLGRPQRVVAMGGRLTKTDITDLDNVAILLRYDRAIAIAESSWSWIGGYPSAGP
jgi:predicted dehydrogenase